MIVHEGDCLIGNLANHSDGSVQGPPAERRELSAGLGNALGRPDSAISIVARSLENDRLHRLVTPQLQSVAIGPVLRRLHADDPVNFGLVVGLYQPGGNVTGVDPLTYGRLRGRWSRPALCPCCSRANRRLQGLPSKNGIPAYFAFHLMRL